MRLSLTLACCAALGAAGCGAVATHDASARVHVLADERITVLTPAVRDEVEVRHTRASVEYAVDVVSGATQALTADAISTATTFADTRHEVQVGVSQRVGDAIELTASETVGYEPDHAVHAPSAGLSVELMSGLARASARYGLSLEWVGRVDEPAVTEQSVGHRIDLDWTQIASKRLVLTALLTVTGFRCGDRLGCFSNPYRYVAVDGAPGGRLALLERHPDDRFTGAGGLRLAWALAPEHALVGGYRFARDTWGIGAHSADVAFASELLSRRLLVRPEARATVQGASSFWRAQYRVSGAGAPAYRTADAEQSRLWNALLQVHFAWTLGPVDLVAETGRMWCGYPEFSALPMRRAWLGGLGVDASF